MDLECGGKGDEFRIWCAWSSVNNKTGTASLRRTSRLLDNTHTGKRQHPETTDRDNKEKPTSVIFLQLAVHLYRQQKKTKHRRKITTDNLHNNR